MKKRVKPTELVILHYSHRHGDDLIPVVLKGGLPEITNELLKSLDIWEPELLRDDEYAEWMRPPITLGRLPTLVSPRDWSPRGLYRKNMYVAILSLYSADEGLSAIMVLVPQGNPENLPEITEELLESFGIRNFDLEDDDNVAGWNGPSGPVTNLPKV